MALHDKLGLAAVVLLLVRLERALAPVIGLERSLEIVHDVPIRHLDRLSGEVLIASGGPAVGVDQEVAADGVRVELELDVLSAPVALVMARKATNTSSSECTRTWIPAMRPTVMVCTRISLDRSSG